MCAWSRLCSLACVLRAACCVAVHLGGRCHVTFFVFPPVPSPLSSSCFFLCLRLSLLRVSSCAFASLFFVFLPVPLLPARSLGLDSERGPGSAVHQHVPEGPRQLSAASARARHESHVFHSAASGHPLGTQSVFRSLLLFPPWTCFGLQPLAMDSLFLSVYGPSVCPLSVLSLSSVCMYVCV